MDISLSYSEFKSVVNSKYVKWQYQEFVNRYLIFALDATITYVTIIFKPGYEPTGLDVSQNTSDRTDFLTNYYPSINDITHLNVSLSQAYDLGNSKTFTSADGANTFTGTWHETRLSAIVGQLTIISSNVLSGLGGTFTFQYSEDATTPVVNESKTITDFSSVRDFNLLNAGAYYRVIFTPSRALTGSETITIITTHERQHGGNFARFANQQIEEQNAAMGQQFSYLKGFDEATGLSINIRPNSNGELTVSDSTAQATLTNMASGTVEVKKLYDLVTTGTGTEYTYIGVAPLGTASSAGAWTIRRMTYSNGDLTVAEWSSNTAIWDNRASTTYT